MEEQNEPIVCVSGKRIKVKDIVNIYQNCERQCFKNGKFQKFIITTHIKTEEKEYSFDKKAMSEIKSQLKKIFKFSKVIEEDEKNGKVKKVSVWHGTLKPKREKREKRAPSNRKKIAELHYEMLMTYVPAMKMDIDPVEKQKIKDITNAMRDELISLGWKSGNQMSEVDERRNKKKKEKKSKSEYKF